MVAHCSVGWLGGSVGASSLGWFLSGFGWFLLVEDNFWLFSFVCCFSSYTNFTAYRRVITVARDWIRSLDFFIQSKTTRKTFLLPYRLAVWKLVIISYTLLCFMSDKKTSFKEIFWSIVTKHKARGCIAKYLRRGDWLGSVRKIFKNREIIRIHWRRGEMNQDREIFSSYGERQQVCRKVQYDCFSLS